MANQYWGAPAIAEYSPMPMSELAWGPEKLYARDKAAEDALNTMNEANLTLQGVLGSAAGKQEEFTNKYQEALAKIQTEGATKRNLELAKEARNLYLTHVVPMQDFAKKREAMAAEYSKLRLNGDNIISGRNPLDVSFDEYMKNPESLSGFNAVDRDKLNALGRLYGENYAQGITDRDYTDADLGIVNIVKGFRNADEAFKAYQNDPKFRGLVETQVNQIAQARGLDPNNADVRQAISGGIMSGVVGKMERLPIPSTVLKSIMSGGSSDQNLPSFINIEDNPNINLSEGDLKEDANKDPEMKKMMDEKFNQVSGGKYPTYESWRDRNKGKSWTNPDDIASWGKNAYEDMGLESQVDEMLKTNPFFANTQMLRINEARVADLGETDAKKKFWEIQKKTQASLERALLSGELLDKAYTSDGNDLLKKIKDAEVVIDWDNIKVDGVGLQGVSSIGPDRRRKVAGTGKPVIMVTMDVKEKGTQGSKKVTVPIKPPENIFLNAMAGLQTLYSDQSASQADRDAISNAYSLYERHRKSQKTVQ